MAATSSADLAVVVPARNEEGRIGGCLESILAQDVIVQVFLSNNGSVDRTLERAAPYGDRLDLVTRTVDSLLPTEHFVSAARWALAQSDAPYFAYLAGDDTWAPGFAQAGLSALATSPEASVAYPTFIGPDRERPLHMRPTSFMSPRSRVRRAKALLMPDSRKFPNLVYGIYRREAFADLADAWESAGDRYGSDFAAAWSLLKRHRVVPAERAVNFRHERRDVDLLEGIGVGRTGREGLLGQARLFVTVYVRVNGALGRALLEVEPGRPTWLPPMVQAARAPGLVWDAAVQTRDRLAAQRR